MRILLFILLALSGFIAPWWLLLPLTILYAFRYTAYELLFLGAVLDLSYGLQVFGVVFPVLYTSVAFLIVMLAETLKPRLKSM